ncbi:MAG: SAM-dependent methyltransferase [Planctomycetota bacterium]|jgi:SAM-dependent methyltransferase
MDAVSAIPAPLRPLIKPAEIDYILEDLGIDVESARTMHQPGEGATADALVILVDPGQGAAQASIEAVCQVADKHLSESGALLLFLEGRQPDSRLAAWRNGLWPLLHANVIYDVQKTKVVRRTVSGAEELDTGKRKTHKVRSGSVLFLRRRKHAMGPDATIEKFDQNASKWNGDPNGPSYPHFRWMRRLVGCFAKVPSGGRLLDFGCGAGWCGIEAARRFNASELAFFDPSPLMVKIAEENARKEGIKNPVGRTGFGENPPFPAEGEEPFDGVISSGVISFSPDPKVWIDGLVSTVKQGGVLVIGDIQLTSRGMKRRRREKPLLPARELNASTANITRKLLEARGFKYTGGAGYQLTRPFPEAMHVNEIKLKGLLTYPLLWSNQIAAATNRAISVPNANQFDSWVMSFVRQ